MRKGWFVDRVTGVPIVATRDERHHPELIAAGHPMIAEPMPRGMMEPRTGRFAKWGGREWVVDAERETQWRADRDAREQEQEDRRTEYQILVDNIGNEATIRADLDRVVRILGEIYRP